jgi:hypothetical protein
VLQYLQGEALGNIMTVEHTDDTTGCRAVWARGQYHGIGDRFVISNWTFADQLFRVFARLRQAP